MESVGRSLRAASCAPITIHEPSHAAAMHLYEDFAKLGTTGVAEHRKSIRHLDHVTLGAQGGQSCALADAGVL